MIWINYSWCTRKLSQVQEEYEDFQKEWLTEDWLQKASKAMAKYLCLYKKKRIVQQTNHRGKGGLAKIARLYCWHKLSSLQQCMLLNAPISKIWSQLSEYLSPQAKRRGVVITHKNSANTLNPDGFEKDGVTWIISWNVGSSTILRGPKPTVTVDKAGGTCYSCVTTLIRFSVNSK